MFSEALANLNAIGLYFSKINNGIAWIPFQHERGVGAANGFRLQQIEWTNEINS